MVHFRSLFRRSKKQTAAQFDDVASPVSNPDLVAMRVAGMQRSNQGTYMTTYTSTTLSANTSRTSTSDTSTTSDSSRTAVESDSTLANGKSVWQGTPNGTSYDKREELTAEDEDMWANMAM